MTFFARSLVVSIVVALLAIALPPIGPAQAQDGPAEAPARVMILGTYHFAGSDSDVVQVSGGAITSDSVQAQIRTVVDSLADFEQTSVAVERTPSSAPRLDSLYRAYRRGAWDLAPNEIYQLGFRLADRFDLASVDPIDHPGEFPIKQVMAYAQKHDPSLLQYLKEFESAYGARIAKMIQNEPVRAVLAFMNSEEGLQPQASIYARIAAVGDTSQYPGATLTTAWYERNLRIFTHLATVAEPGSRVLVIFGAGHAPILRRLVEAHPTMTLVEPLAYL